MEEDDMVIRVGSSLMIERDEPMRREGLQARGIYKEVPRPSRRLALATRQKIPYNNLDTHSLYRERLYRPIFRNLLTITYTTLLVLKSTAYTAISATY
jgi:hypothetical protein